MAPPVLSADLLREAVPGNIRKAKHFVQFLRTVALYLQTRMQATTVTKEDTATFLAHLQRETSLTSVQALQFCHSRLGSLMKTLEITDIDEYNPVQLVANFATLAATYSDGFKIIMEPEDAHNPEALLQLCCLDASLAVAPVFDRFRNVVITSGTLSPLDLYPKILAFEPVVTASLSMSITRNCIQPMIVTKGSDQTPLTSKFDVRQDTNVVQNYGKLLAGVCSAVPDGIVCSFAMIMQQKCAHDAFSLFLMFYQCRHSQSFYNRTIDTR